MRPKNRAVGGVALAWLGIVHILSSVSMVTPVASTGFKFINSPSASIGVFFFHPFLRSLI